MMKVKKPCEEILENVDIYEEIERSKELIREIDERMKKIKEDQRRS